MTPAPGPGRVYESYDPRVLGGFYDPQGERWGLPTFPWRSAPAGYATRRQLAERGLRPNGQDIQAQLLRGRGNREPLRAYLYRVEDAAPKRPATPAQLVALAKATRARQDAACERHLGADWRETYPTTSEHDNEHEAGWSW